jgi:hypothetical protein
MRYKNIALDFGLIITKVDNDEISATLYRWCNNINN